MLAWFVVLVGGYWQPPTPPVPKRLDHCAEAISLQYRTNIVLLFLWGPFIKTWCCFKEKNHVIRVTIWLCRFISFVRKGFWINKLKARINDIETFIVQWAVVGICCCSSIVNNPPFTQALWYIKVKWSMEWSLDLQQNYTCINARMQPLLS